MSKVFTQNGVLRNVGDWPYQIYQQEVIGNPFPGPLDAPDGWDYQITYVDVVGNPLPDDHIEEDIDWYFDEKGSAQLLRDKPALDAAEEAAKELAGLQAEFDSIWPDVVLGVADEQTMDRARYLRAQLKAA